MLQEQSRLFQRLLSVADLVLVAVGWVLAHWVRFDLLRHAGALAPPAYRPLPDYLAFVPWVVLVSALVFFASGLYAPDRAQRRSRLVLSVARAVGLGLVVLAATLSFYRELYFSRLHLLLFGAITPVLLVALRLALFAFVLRLRRRGKYHRRVLIVGAGRVGRRLGEAFRQYPWIGFDILGWVDDEKTGPDILGRIDDVPALLDAAEREGAPIDYVYIALPLSAATRIEALVETLSTYLAHVCLVPDLFGLNLLNSRVTDLDGLPVLHLIDETPFEGRRVVKRAVDIVFSALFLLVASPLMLLIAAGVRLSSPGPVFYRQERMGLNGHRFEMLKFRSMPVGVERASGPVWAQPGEQRATPLGAFLRRTSLDELPQFLNVLRGDMSIVGPRPERPVFIESFRERVPGYMLRHKMKAGITGWAQVHGWRGDTSIEKRIEHDLYYIQHWSLGLDLKIMWMTLWRGFVHENAY